jgi:hypothetical protein
MSRIVIVILIYHRQRPIDLFLTLFHTTGSARARILHMVFVQIKNARQLTATSRI